VERRTKNRLAPEHEPVRMVKVMHNSFHWSARKSASPTETRKARKARDRNARFRRHRDGMILAAALVAVGAVVGNGLVLQPALAAQSESIAATAAHAASTGKHSEQLDSHARVLGVRADESAKATLTVAMSTVAAAKGKTDATALTASVASLSYYTRLFPEQVFQLVENTKAETATLQAATAAVDRASAAKSAAAAKAAAAKAAAAQAAAAKAVAAKAAAAPAASSRPSAPANPSGAQAIARSLMAAQYGWGTAQFGCLVSLWDRESGWNVNAYNSSSGATGIPQALPGSKMATAGADWRTSAATQITWGLGYIADRYGTPCAAWSHSESVGWY